MKKILTFISKYRKKQANLDLLKNSLLILIFIVLYIIPLSIIENIFYLNTAKRSFYFILFITFNLIFFSYIILKWILSYFPLLNNNLIIAKKIGSQFKQIKDRLINIIQLNQTNPDSSLTQLAIKKINKELSNIKFLELKFNFSKKYIYYSISIIIMSMLFFITLNLQNAVYRIINYNKHFNPPLPYEIICDKENFHALSGDTVNIKFSVKGTAPDSINIYWFHMDKLHQEKISNKSNQYIHNINNVKTDIKYWANTKTNNWFSSWDSIGTKPYNIKIKKRPIIENIKFIISPPEYTEIDPYSINGTNNQIQIIANSKINFEGKANKKLNNSWLLLNEKRINLDIKDNIISGEIALDSTSLFTIYCLDENMVPNLNPTQYTLVPQHDKAPTIITYSPNQEFEIDESYNINTNFNIIDDYGLHDIFIEYELIVSNENNNTLKGAWDLKQNFLKNQKNININKTFNIMNFNLSMGDEIHLTIIAKDYKQTSKSNKFIGRFPTLEELFETIENYEESNEEWIDNMEESIDEILENTEEAYMKLLKNQDLSIEEEKNIAESIQKTNELFEEIEKIQENIEKIQEQAEKNKLFDQELMNKFDHFQELLQNMMTPELMEAMEKLQEAMQEMDSNKLMQALENFEFNVQEFESQLDKFIDMFEMAQAEQKINELKKTIEHIIEKQNSLIEKMQSDSTKTSMLSSRAEKQKERFKEFENILEEAKKSTESMAPNISKKLDDLAKNNTTKKAKDNLDQAKEEIKNEDISSAKNKSKNAKEQLEEISEKINEISKEFSKQTKQEITDQFLQIIENLISISNQQEEIIKDTKDIHRNNSKLKTINSNQNLVNRQLSQIMNKILELSNKTFFMKPNINRAFGKIQSSMNKAISHFEQKKISQGKKEQSNTYHNINLTIYLLLDALEEMQNSENASGFEQFLEAMEGMSKQQQGINDGTMQLNQFGLAQQRSLMEQLQSQQEKLQKQLEDLLEELPGPNQGNAEKINNDMEEVIQD
ncbi:MAG: hypothetical protein CMG64_00730, partial [Candidatus Marinimicrobia bacterium]|nr:hypothetical protein [Candidatus Neomarinimicrobiota bacterium]